MPTSLFSPESSLKPCFQRVEKRTAIFRQVLFQALDAPDDDLKVIVMECLLEVPVNNLQASEVANIVSIVADCDNLTVGRTEEILGAHRLFPRDTFQTVTNAILFLAPYVIPWIGHTFSILKKLGIDEGDEGTHFRLLA